MGRRSSLTEKQWAEIGKRLIAGESTSALAREYGVSKSTISERFSERTNRVKATAGLIVKAETALHSLSISEQISARTLADELRSISMHLAGAGKFGAATAHRLAGIAHGKVNEIDDAAPISDESLLALKGIAVLTRMANDSSVIGLNLLSANKEMVKAGMQEEPLLPVRIIVQVEDASLPES